MMERILINAGGILDYDTTFLSTEKADQLFSFFKENIIWEQKHYTHFKTGVSYPQPRLTAWYADSSDMEYSYSGVTQVVQTWIPELLELKSAIETITEAKYNSVLLNYYRDGNDSVGMHSDNEKELGVNANIASVSLGANRVFQLAQFKKVKGSSEELGYLEYELSHGSLLVMSGTTQHYWKHAIPKAVEAGPRINLTFRYFYS
jgi:alkylated DNA repair dioxygenase AlkB